MGSGLVLGVVVFIGLVAGIIIFRKGIRTVPQAHVAVVTRFGKHRKIMQAGLHFLNPFLDKVATVIPVQNQTASLQFAAITEDQASVDFTATIIYTVADYQDETIQLVAFKFINQTSFDVALTSAVEASVREFVASKKQSEVLGLRQSIVDHAKNTLDDQLASWGYELVDLTVNDIAFDSDVMKSMSRVVAAKNAQTAAEYEGQALLITRTKQAEAEGKALVIAAENGAEAARLRGEGIAAQRAAIAKGLSESSSMLSEAGLDISILAFSLWTETLREIAVQAKGNTVFLDGGMTSFEDSLRRTQGFLAAPHMPPDGGSPLDLGQVSGAAASDAGAGGTTSRKRRWKDAGGQGESAARAAEAAASDITSTVSDLVTDVLGTVGNPDGGSIGQKVADAVTRRVNPPAGWYPNPQKPGSQRYWDGNNWR